MDQTSGELSTKGKQEWIASVKREFQNGPLASNVVFAFILTILEKLVEMEFECPCEGTKLNCGFVATFFVIPGILAFVLMASVQGLKCLNIKDNINKIVHCCLPAFLWIILLLFDGRYIACKMTDWSGRYVLADKAAPLKWCEPENGTLYQDRLKKSQEWYFKSQWVGLGLALVLVLFFAKCIMNKCTELQQCSPSAQSDPGICAPPGQTDEESGSGLAVPLRPCPTDTPDTEPAPLMYEEA